MKNGQFKPDLKSVKAEKPNRTFVKLNRKPKVNKPRKCKICGTKYTHADGFVTWCSSDCGFEILKKRKEKAQKKEIAEMKINTHSKEYKKHFQGEVNKLSRMIDTRFELVTCIDCDKPFGKQTDACHFHGRGGNCTLRYNFHNLHSGKSDCNQWSDKHKQGYEKGLAKRYGEKYADYVINQLPLVYKEIHLSNQDIVDKLKLVRYMVKHFSEYNLENPLQARNIFNEQLGIYLNNYQL